MAVLVLAAPAVPAAAAAPLRLRETCRIATDPALPLRDALSRLTRCADPVSRNHSGTLWAAFDAAPAGITEKTWRLTFDNHRSRSFDMWLVGAAGRTQHYRYDPAAPDREWAAGNYFSILATAEFPVAQVVVRLGDAQGHSFVRLPQAARARDFAPYERNQAALYGMGVGMLALTILFHLSLFFAIRRRFQLVYCAHVCLLLTYGLCYSGLIRLFAPGLSATGVSDLISFAMAAATGTGLAFISEFLGEVLSRTVRRWALAGAATSAMAALAILFAPAPLSFAANLFGNFAALHAIGLTTAMLVIACRRRHPLAGMVTLGWIPPIAISLLYPMRTFGLLPPVDLPDGLMMVASTLECLVLSMPVASRIRQLRIEHERAAEREAILEHQAQTDSLTGLANRRGFGDALTRTSADQADAWPVALLLIDIDHFKRVNDAHGHATGDEILKVVASHVARVAGGGAIVARMGGEEFLVALRNHDLARAGTIAERIRLSLPTTLEARRDLPPVTISIGVAAGQSDQMDALRDDADCALYRAKNEGRNRVMLADGPLMYAAAA